MAMLYELARTWLGALCCWQKELGVFFTPTVIYTVMMLINSEGDQGQRLVMIVSRRLTVVTFFPFVEHMNQNDSLGK